METCREFSRQFYRQVNDAWHAINECQRGEVHFGRCAWGELRAWVQCCEASREAERLSDEAEKKTKACWDQANERRKRELEEERAQVAHDKEEETLASSMRAGNDAVRAVRAAVSAISRPTEFLNSALRSASSSMVRTMLFGEKGKTLKRPDVAEELYRYLQLQASTASRITPTSPVIRAIQQDSLKELARYHSQVMDELHRSLGQLAKVDSAVPAARPTTPVSGPAPRARAPATRRNPDCAILKDMQESRRLAEQNFSRWVALSEECLH